VNEIHHKYRSAFVGCWYILDLANAWKVEHIKISVLLCFVVPHCRSEVATKMQNFRTT